MRSPQDEGGGHGCGDEGEEKRRRRRRRRDGREEGIAMDEDDDGVKAMVEFWFWKGLVGSQVNSKVMLTFWLYFSDLTLSFCVRYFMLLFSIVEILKRSV